MNDYLLNNIKQDFLVLKTVIQDNFKLAQFLRIDFSDISTLIDKLRVSKDNYDIDVKKDFLREIFIILDDALYKMITPGKLNECIKNINLLLFLVAVQYKTITQKKVDSNTKKKVELDPEMFSLKDIVKEVAFVAREFPEANMYLRVISNLLKKYKDLSSEMEEKLLLTNEKNRDNVKKTYEEELTGIINSIKKQFYNMVISIPKLKKNIEDRYLEIDNSIEETFDITNIDYNNLKVNLTKQLSEFSRIRSYLFYIKKESIDVLPIIKELFNNSKHFYEVIDNEETSLFYVLSDNNIPVENYSKILSSLNNEIIKYLNDKFLKLLTSR